MYICPTCFREFRTEEKIRKHFLACWKEQHSHHESASAPRGEDIEIKSGNENVLTFFEILQRGYL